MIQVPREVRLAEFSCSGGRFMPMNGDMRLSAAILAMLMAVTTGGPLRCPCQIWALLKSEAVESQQCIALPTVEDDEACCSCKSHHIKHDNKPPEPEKRSPRHLPCKHGPAIDIAPPISHAEGVGEHHDLAAAVDLSVESAIPPIVRLLAPSGCAPSEPLASPLHALKYCFAFRC